MITNATPPTAAVANDIRDIKPPIEISGGLAWLLVDAGGAGRPRNRVATFGVGGRSGRRTGRCLRRSGACSREAKAGRGLALIAQPKPFVIGFPIRRERIWKSGLPFVRRSGRRKNFCAS